jgi:hypothetical protein
MKPMRHVSPEEVHRRKRWTALPPSHAVGRPYPAFA